MQAHRFTRLSFVILYCIVMNVLWARAGDVELTDLHGEYLGQELPGLKPEPFAPEIFSVWSDYGFHLISSIFFSPGGNELFFTDQTNPAVPPCSSSIWHTQQKNNIWTRPRVATFSGIHSDKCVDYSRNRNVLYFVSTRPVPGKGTPRDLDIWSVEKEKDRWIEPVRLGYPINTASNDMSVVMSADGTVFFSSDRAGGKGGSDIYWSQFVNGQYTPAENLGDSVNTGGDDQVVCVAHDASFLILYRLDETDKADAGLYITFRKENGVWIRAKSMGDHINNSNASSASLSPDGKYLFFLSRGDGMYWLSTELIGYLKNEDLNVSAIMIEAFHREGLNAALTVYGKLKERHSEFIDIEEYLLNQRGYTLLHSGHVDEAIVLFEICVAINPDSWNAYDSVGEAYLEAGLIDQAIESYKKSLELNSKNKNAAMMLERLSP
jgi:hypothetical protein